MRFHIITIVWGVRHAQLFLDLTLPNVLSDRNLPQLAREHEVTYRFFTTPETRDLIAQSDAGKRLTEICDVEFLTPLGNDLPDVSWHVHWFHRSAAEGKVRGAAVMFIPPDTLWTDGSLSRMGMLLASGKTGVACPFVLVTSETCIDEARTRFLDQETHSLTIPWTEMWSLAGRHLHPLHALAIPGGPHARPAFELHFPVQTAGMISCYAVRELVAFDPARCPISFLWYADDPQPAENIYFATGSDEMLMLSVDPLSKYFQNYIVDHSCNGFDVARTTRHPLNDTPFTRRFASQLVSIADSPDRPGAWRRQRLRAFAAGRDILCGRLAMLIYDELMREGASVLAGLLSVGLFDTHLVRRWRVDVPLTIVVPGDQAMAPEDRDAFESCAAVGQSGKLVEVLRDHVIAGKLSHLGTAETLSGTPVTLGGDQNTKINDAAILVGPLHVEGIEFYIVDKILTNRLPRSPSKPGGSQAGSGLRGFAQSLLARLVTNKKPV